MPSTSRSSGSRYTICMGNKVRKLRKADDWDEWWRGVQACLLPKGAQDHVFRDEPFRRTDEEHHITIYRPAHQIAGTLYPYGKQIDPSLGIGRLTLIEQMRYDPWLTNERLARSVLLITVDCRLIKQVEELWCAKDMYNALGAILFADEDEDDDDDNAFKQDDLYRQLRYLLLDDDASPDDMDGHMGEFVAIMKSLRKYCKPVSSKSAVCIFLNSLQGDTEQSVKAAYIAKCPDKNKWMILKDVFKAYVGSLRHEGDNHTAGQHVKIEVDDVPRQ